MISNTEYQLRNTRNLVTAIITCWFFLVVFGAKTNFLSNLYMPLIALIVASTIAIPVTWYFYSQNLRLYMIKLGHRNIILMHSWRIPAAILFFWYGYLGELPNLFWILAGVGDFIAGSMAVWFFYKPESHQSYKFFHRFGFADFIIAVGTGLTFTLMQDEKMGLITKLPMALIPLFGVGISGASHIMAFDMLKKKVGFKKKVETK